MFAFKDSTSRVGTQVTAAAVVDDTTHGVHMALAATRTATDLYDYFYALDSALTTATERVRLTGTRDVYCLIPSIGATVLANDTTFATVTNVVTPATRTSHAVTATPSRPHRSRRCSISSERLPAAFAGGILDTSRGMARPRWYRSSTSSRNVKAAPQPRASPAEGAPS